ACSRTSTMTCEIAASAISIAPRTDSSASMFCGGTAVWGGATVNRRAATSGGRTRASDSRDLALLHDHGLHARHHIRGDIDLDHVSAELFDRLLQAHVPPVDAQSSRLPDRIDDLLRGDRAEETAIG